MNISERIALLQTRKLYGHATPFVGDGVEVSYKHTSTEQINTALRNVLGQDRLELAIDLFRLWNEAERCDRENPRKEEARLVFGEVFDRYGSRALMYTITSTSRELRVWHGIPCYIAEHHVDSNGLDNLLFTVSGEPEFVRRYLSGLLVVHKLRLLPIPENGVRIYMDWG